MLFWGAIEKGTVTRAYTRVVSENWQSGQIFQVSTVTSAARAARPTDIPISSIALTPPSLDTAWSCRAGHTDGNPTYPMGNPSDSDR